MSGNAQKPVFFLHIPKTAGTSFLLTLQNTFGDRFVHRLESLDETVPSQLEALIAAGSEQAACISGHLPFHYVEPHLEQVSVFTVLRHPVDRVVSLYRFLRTRPAEELHRLALDAEFSIADLFESRHPELFGQVREGIVRMLSGDHKLFTPDCEQFWSEPLGIETLQNAFSNLQRMDFGLAEDMTHTLELARAAWSIPYRLRTYQLNRTTGAEATEKDLIAIQQIVSHNVLDLALYHRAQQLFRERCAAAASRPREPSEYNANAVCRLLPMRDTRVGDIAGRSGFFEYEEIGIAWLHDEAAAEVHFVVPDKGAKQLALYVRAIHDSYPIADTVLELNGRKLRFQLAPGPNGFHVATTAKFNPKSGLNELRIVSPLFCPVSSIDPDTKDTRRLGLAISRLRLEAAS